MKKPVMRLAKNPSTKLWNRKGRVDKPVKTGGWKAFKRQIEDAGK